MSGPFQDVSHRTQRAGSYGWKCWRVIARDDAPLLSQGVFQTTPFTVSQRDECMTLMAHAFYSESCRLH